MPKEEIDIMTTNLAGLGSDEDIAARVAAAKTEEAWQGAGTAPGMQIWRIEKFQVKASKTPKGHFYSDDSYICLNTYKAKDEEGKETDKLAWDVHFWLGKTTSMDEMGTAAYKTVELDDLLGGGPVQHREVMGHESKLFLSYFKDCGGIRILEGGIESGFNHVEPESYKPRLLHIKGKKRVRVEEKPIAATSVNNGDVFILDAGMNLIVWQGTKCGLMERQKGAELGRAIDDERKGVPEVHVVRAGDADEDKFWEHFEGGKPDSIAEEDGDDMSWESNDTKALYKLSDSTGELKTTKIDDISRDAFTSDDVFIYDIGCEVFAWVGKGASTEERKGAMTSASNYLSANNRPNWLPVSVIYEGGENEVFTSSFS